MTLLTVESAETRPVPAEAGRGRRVRVVHFCPWAGRLADGGAFLSEVGGLDLASRVSDPASPDLMRMARLDCDWHAENVRALGSARASGLEFLPIQAVGPSGLADLLAVPVEAGVERWLVITGQHPQLLGATGPRFLAACARRGIRVLYYAFDDASRNMTCFASIAPHLSVLIHDEAPLAPVGRRALAPACLTVRRSWVANLVPFSVPFSEAPEPRIVFLGSKLGLSAHRRRQLDFLRRRLGDRLVAICDHSLPVAERASLGRYQASFCPEGRMFATESMSQSHTDRPFWSGCLGMAAVSEDSRQGGRLEELHQAGLIWRYPHGDLDALAAACERALASTVAERRRVYEHFNAKETVGSVVASAIAAAGAPAC